MMATPPLIRLRNSIADGFQDDARQLVVDLVTGPADWVIRLANWFGRFLGLIRSGVTAGYLLGRDPVAFVARRAALDAQGAATVERLVSAQGEFATGFLADVQAAFDTGAPLSEAAIGARSELYSGSIVQATSVGETERFGLSLPYHPTEGSPCGGRCRCWWQITETASEIVATWRAVDDDGTCGVCSDRASQPPIGITKGLAA